MYQDRALAIKPLKKRLKTFRVGNITLDKFHSRYSRSRAAGADKTPYPAVPPGQYSGYGAAQMPARSPATELATMNATVGSVASSIPRQPPS